MTIKIFDLPEESLSSSDSRVNDFLEERYGEFKSSGGCSFSLSKEQLFQLNKIFKDNNVENVWGSSESGKYGNFCIDYLIVVSNKKMYLIYEKIMDAK